jgi:hypothetical protein
MLQTYTGMAEFLVEFMFQLCSSKEITDVEQILVSIVATRVHFLEFENPSPAQKKEIINELQQRIFNLNISQQAKYCAMLQLYDAILKQSDLRTSLTGFDTSEVFGNRSMVTMEKKSLEALLTMLTQSSPWDITDEHQKRILLRSALFISIYLPSKHSGSAKNRLRLLTLLALKQLDRFLDEV